MTRARFAHEPDQLQAPPPALPQFQHIRRAWDGALGACVARLLPGEYYVTRHDELLFTVLGSCVSACIRDRKLGIGGMNHFMLPFDRRSSARGTDNAPALATRFGDVAMERLLYDVMALGGRREDLEFKVVGGGKVLDIALDVGARNANFVREYLQTAGFAISAEDLGNTVARKVYYSPSTGKLRVKRLAATVVRAVFERERSVLSGNAQHRAATETQ